MNKILTIEASLINNEISGFDFEKIIQEVMHSKNLVILKNVFPKNKLADLRSRVNAWAKATEPALADDFRENYHRKRVMVSRVQQAPHVFHDYNFHNFGVLEENLQSELTGFFTPLITLYKKLTGNESASVVPGAGPYLHPQIIQYPNGGGFFGRHWHNLLPQKLGFIVLLSKPNIDFRASSTVFDIDGQTVDVGNAQDIGDILVWRYDYDHWVSQTDLSQKFDWNSVDGRWVATLAYFDPQGEAVAHRSNNKAPT